MRSEKGITMLSLIIYVLLIISVIAIFANITRIFYSNINQFDTESKDAIAFSKFNMYFLNDIKKKTVEIDEISENYIVLLADNEEIRYSLVNNSLYRNKVKICDNVTDFKLSTNSDKSNVKVDAKIGDYKKTTTYVIESEGKANNRQVI